jgi:hypothetical protein
MVPVPYGMKYKATARGSVPKVVRCESCSLEYVYLLEAKAEGESTSLLFLENEGAAERSRQSAEAKLQSTLEQGFDVVPCPGCGRIQEHMIGLAKARRHAWMYSAAVCAPALARLSLFRPRLQLPVRRPEGGSLPLGLLRDPAHSRPGPGLHESGAESQVRPERRARGEAASARA